MPRRTNPERDRRKRDAAANRRQMPVMRSRRSPVHPTSELPYLVSDRTVDEIVVQRRREAS